MILRNDGEAKDGMHGCLHAYEYLDPICAAKKLAYELIPPPSYFFAFTRSSSAASVCSQANSCWPKWPYAAVLPILCPEACSISESRRRCWKAPRVKRNYSRVILRAVCRSRDVRANCGKKAETEEASQSG
jgi:hypothetical protein